MSTSPGSHHPHTPFSAGPALLDGRELSGRELLYFRARARRDTILFALVLVAVPIGIFMMAQQASEPIVRERIRPYESGAPHVVADYIVGTRHGSYKEYYEAGELKVEGWYDNDLRTGEWTTYDRAGTARTKGQFRQGRKVAVWETFNRHGQVTERRSLDQNGYADGVWETFYADGGLEFQASFREGLRHGRERVWNRSGTLLSDIGFHEGERYGPAFDYNSDGTLHVQPN